MELKRYLQDQGYNLSRLANRIGISPNAFYAILSGRQFPSKEQAEKIAAFTGGDWKPDKITVSRQRTCWTLKRDS